MNGLILLMTLAASQAPAAAQPSGSWHKTAERRNGYTITIPIAQLQTYGQGTAIANQIDPSVKQVAQLKLRFGETQAATAIPLGPDRREINVGWHLVTLNGQNRIEFILQLDPAIITNLTGGAYQVIIDIPANVQEVGQFVVLFDKRQLPQNLTSISRSFADRSSSAATGNVGDNTSGGYVMQPVQPASGSTPYANPSGYGNQPTNNAASGNQGTLGGLRERFNRVSNQANGNLNRAGDLLSKARERLAGAGVANPGGGYNSGGYQAPGATNPGGYQPGQGQPTTGTNPGYQQPGANSTGAGGYGGGYNPATAGTGYGTQGGYQNPGGGYVPPGGSNAPGTSPPGYNQPGYNQPGTSQPGYNQPGYNQPGSNQPGSNPPGSNQPGTNQPVPGAGYYAGTPGSNPPDYTYRPPLGPGGQVAVNTAGGSANGPTGTGQTPGTPGSSQNPLGQPPGPGGVGINPTGFDPSTGKAPTGVETNTASPASSKNFAAVMLGLLISLAANGYFIWHASNTYLKYQALIGDRRGGGGRGTSRRRDSGGRDSDYSRGELSEAY